MIDAETVLDRFGAQIRWITESLLDKFGLEPHYLEDLRQDASMLVLSYAGLIEGTHYGILSSIEKTVKGDERQVRKLVAYRLRKDLSQKVSRSHLKEPPLANRTVDELIESDREPSEPSHETESDNQMDEAQYLRKYPTFARNILDGVSQPELADQLGISLPTVERRIRGEKRSFLTDTLKRANLVVEGDETMDELEEAYGYVTKSRR